MVGIFSKYLLSELESLECCGRIPLLLRVLREVHKVSLSPLPLHSISPALH